MFEPGPYFIVYAVPVPRTRRRREHGHAVARAVTARLCIAGASSRVSAVYASRVYSLAVPPAHAGRFPRRSIGLSLAAPGVTVSPGGLPTGPLG